MSISFSSLPPNSSPSNPHIERGFINQSGRMCYYEYNVCYTCNQKFCHGQPIGYCENYRRLQQCNVHTAWVAAGGTTCGNCYWERYRQDYAVRGGIERGYQEGQPREEGNRDDQPLWQPREDIQRAETPLWPGQNVQSSEDQRPVGQEERRQARYAEDQRRLEQLRRENEELEESSRAKRQRREDRDGQGGRSSRHRR